MRNSFIIATLLLLLVGACFNEGPITAPPGGNGFPLGVQLDDLVGLWTGIKTQLTPQNGSLAPLDLLEAGGQTTLEVADDGRFALIITDARNESQVVTGQFESSNGSVNVILDSDAAESGSWILIKTGTILVIQGSFEYHFLGTTNAQPTDIQLEMVVS